MLRLEAGGEDRYLWIDIPVGYLYCIGNPRTDWLFRTAEAPGLGGHSIGYPRGKVFGGSSSINGIICMHGQRGDYGRWAVDGNPGWSWDEVLPYFVRHEDHHTLDAGGSDPMHGHGGEWRVERARVTWEILDAFRDAAAQAGILPSDDFNRGDNFGCGYFDVNPKRGVRWNASKAFLRPVRRRPTLKVAAHAQVTGLARRMDGPSQVEGIEYRIGSVLEESKRTLFDGEVVLSAGASGAPQILQCAGIDAGTRSREAGVIRVTELSGVGANLQDHLQLRVINRVRNVRTLNRQARSLIGEAGFGLDYLLFRSGPMSMSPSQFGAFARSSDDESSPDLEYHVQPLSVDRFGEPLHDFPAVTASVCHLGPASRREGRIASPDPFAARRIAPNYPSTEQDRRVAARARQLTRRIVGTDAMRRFEPEEIKPGPTYRSEEALARVAGEVGTTIFHPVGTCMMGPSGDPMAVVDARLRCHRVPGLTIVDASVMPTITSGNTNSPTLMIAKKAAETMLADRRQG